MIISKGRPIHEWFAWYPVKYKFSYGDRVWMQKVWRMRDSQGYWSYAIMKEDFNQGGHGAA